MKEIPSEFDVHPDALNYGSKDEILQLLMNSVFHAIEAEQPNGPAEFLLETEKRLCVVESNLRKVLEIYPNEFVQNPEAYIERNAVLNILSNLLNQADEVEADVGVKPAAQEGLEWAIGEVMGLKSAN